MGKHPRDREPTIRLIIIICWQLFNRPTCTNSPECKDTDFTILCPRKNIQDVTDL